MGVSRRRDFKVKRQLPLDVKSPPLVIAMAAADSIDHLPEFLPFGTSFRVPDIMALARHHSEALRTNTMHRVHSAFELAAVARLQTEQTIRRASSFSLLSELAEAAHSQQEDMVQQSWRIVQAMRAAAAAAASVACFPLAFVRTVSAALWAIMWRPDERTFVLQCDEVDASRLDLGKEE